MSLSNWANELHSNIGPRIKSIVRTLFIITTVLSILLGAVFFILGIVSAIEEDDISYFLLGTLYAIIITPLFCWLGYLSRLSLYALGELTESAEKINKNIEMLAASKAPEANAVPPSPPLQNDEWFCPNCRTIHKKDDFFCGCCGRPKP